MPDVAQATVTLHLSSRDAAFLAQAIKRLPGGKDFNAPLTVDLNGHVAVRAKGHEQPTSVELVLTDSHRSGESVCVSMNRNYLARAAQLGFREVLLFAPHSPACCRDAQRIYVWGLLGEVGRLPADPGAVRIESGGRAQLSHTR